MKKIILFLFLCTFVNLWGFEVADYDSFAKAQEAFYQKNYKAAKLMFEKFEKNFPDSKLFKSSYADYFIGKTEFELENYKNAILYLEKTSFFSDEVHLMTAQAFQYLDNKEKALKYLHKLYRASYKYKSLEFEKKALKLLGNYDEKFVNIYKLRYDEKLELATQLSPKDIIINGDYFFSRGNYSNALKLYNTALSKERNDLLEVQVLKTLFYSKKHSQVIKEGKRMIKNNKYKSRIYFHMGNSYRRLGQIDNSITYLKKVNAMSLQDERNFIIGRLYYLKKDYNNALEYLKKTNHYSAEEFIVKSYEKLGLDEKAKAILVREIKKSPYSNKAAEYRYKLYEKEQNKGYLQWIVKYNFNTLYYDIASNLIQQNKNFSIYNIDNKIEKYADFFKKLEYLSKFEDARLAKIEFDYTDFPKEDAIFKAYLKTKFYEANGEYYQAIRNSWIYNYSFTKYKNLVVLLYPEYYKEIVEKYSAIYNVDKYFIYSVIKQESLFKKDIISSASAYGLMQVILPTAKMFDKDISPEKLLDPDINIKIGTQYLKYLLDRFDNDFKLAAAAYNAGPGNVDKWTQSRDLQIENIPFTQTKNYVKKVLSNYNKYHYFYDIDMTAKNDLD